AEHRLGQALLEGRPPRLDPGVRGVRQGTVARPRRAHQPFTTPSGTRRATLRHSPAPTLASITASTSLYAVGVSSARPRQVAPRTAMPFACNWSRSVRPSIDLAAWWRLWVRPAPWQ